MMNEYYSIFENNICPFFYIYQGDNIILETGWFLDNNEIKYKKKKFIYFEEQLKRYFDGEKIDFNIKLKEIFFSEFNFKVINEIKKIPYGKVITYKDIAEKINNIGSLRAAGTACRKNKFPLVIPCHRVVSVNGIGGYMGNKKESRELNIKRKLLKLEGLNIP